MRQFLILVIGLLCIEPSFAAPWRVLKTTWSSEDEAGFRKFVSILGRSSCSTFDKCIKHPTNPLRDQDDLAGFFYSDCADLPYLLRAYYAAKRGLPFSIISAVESRTPNSSGDIRYSPSGNKPKARIDFVPRPGGGLGPDLSRHLRTIADLVSSGMLRYHPQLPQSKQISPDENWDRLAPDFYSVSIDRKSVVPGTVIYDPNGHVAVVYDVTADGRVLYMDAHPDNSITRGTYGRKFIRTRPGMGAGFKNFRPLTLVGSRIDHTLGTLVGGQIMLAADQALENYDVTQFFGVIRGKSWQEGLFIVDKKPVDYYEWVRARLSKGSLKFHPVEEMRNMMKALCTDIQDRVASVQIAIDKGIHLRPQPNRLPKNIYGSDGDWETYSSPSRDARLKTAFVELFTETVSMVKRHRQSDPRIDYKGTDLIGDLIQAYDQEAAGCKVSYKTSDGRLQSLDYDEVRRRLFLLSFDPYHCVERRWGASGSELSACRDDKTKEAWYNAEQRLRNQIDRTYDIRMNFSLDELNRQASGSGIDRPPETDIRSWLFRSRN